MAEKIYSFYVDADRHGYLCGLFIADDEDVKNIIGKKIHFGEALGKHSDVTVILEEEDLEIVCEDQEFINQAKQYKLFVGYNPFHYLDE
jgi:hypothetical protein